MWCVYMLYNYLYGFYYLSKIGENDNYLELLELRRGGYILIRGVKRKKGFGFVEKEIESQTNISVRISRKKT